MSKPHATYRLQLHGQFGFEAAAEIADYLKALGVSHVYTSPYLQAAPGSTHGYDVVDHSHVNEELGGPEAHRRFVQRLRELGLGHVLDIVPNHMAIGDRRNRWWWDVLENGPSSQYASYFDIDWQTPEEKLRNKVLTPVLGNHYGRVISAKEIKLEREKGEQKEGSFIFRYFDHVFPAAPKSLCGLLKAAAERSCSDYLAFLADSLSLLPDPTVTDRAAQTARHRDKEVIRTLLTRLCAEDKEIAGSIDASITVINNDPDAMDALLERQNYRLAYWRTAERDLGYRRFFNINTLVGLRMETPQVFEDTHRLILDFVRQSVIDGLRVDHPDGLRDPEQYFERLRKAAPNAWIVAEKILEPGEQLRSSWPIAGTTGYDFLNVLGGLFVDSRTEEPMTRLYQEFTNEPSSYAEVAVEKKHFVLREVLGSDVNRLTAAFLEICERHRDHRDFTRHEIHHAIRETVACFPVYRTYVQAEQGKCTGEDVRYVESAIEMAKRRRPDLDSELFDFLQAVLLLRRRGTLEAEFAMQFQQFTGPAMAKGVEDTAFYNYNRFIALNEVGGDPGRYGVSPAEFHQYCTEMNRQWPDTMVASSTHDTKRSEDVRARLSLLSEIPDQWADAIRRWSHLNDHLKRNAFPDRNTEYFFYQTLVGAWPISLERLRAYMEKSVREGKRFTSWTTPNEAYESALFQFMEGALKNKNFLRDFEDFITPLIEPGRVQALSQVLVKMTALGIPDIYQGTEIWDLSLVDPDNRRPVDYKIRRELLAELDGTTPEKVLARSEEGLPKLWVIQQTLRVRDRLSSYNSLAANGEKAIHVIAFQRGDVVCVAPRLTLSLRGNWGETSLVLPEGEWHNVFTGDIAGAGPIALSEILKRFPVALFVRNERSKNLGSGREKS